MVHAHQSISRTHLTKIKKDAAAITRHLGSTQRAVTKNGIYDSSENIFLSRDNTTVFSDEIKTGDVTDQEKSGRCWLFGALNVLRHPIEASLNLENFEFSESYSFFWDKFERANTFYELAIETATNPLTDRRTDMIIGFPQGDGGWWTYATSLFKKYGVIPKVAMPEAKATSNSTELNILLNRKLRKDGLILRAAVKTDSADAVQAIKQRMLAEVYAMLCVAIGTPPETFHFAYRDTDKTYHKEGTMTPLSFYKKHVTIDPDEYVTLLNDPSESRSFNTLYERDKSWNVVGGDRALFLNVDFETLRSATLKQVKNGDGVWFGCDVRKNVTKDGFMAQDAYDFTATFNVDFTMSKAERIQSHDTVIGHAMTIIGVDVRDDKPVQWKVENSWGDEVGKKGIYTMSDEWFAENGFMVVIRKEFLSRELLALFDQEPVKLEMWDTPSLLRD